MVDDRFCVMKLVLTVIVFLCSISVGLAQAPTYTQDIAPIMYKNCLPCHRTGGTAPFPLETFKQVKQKGNFIKYVTEIDYMPPWKANPHYRSFANEKYLTAEEKEKIKKWVEGGTPEGPKDKLPSMPQFPDGSQLLGKPDMVLQMKKPYVVQGNNQEQYICYKIPYELPNDTFACGIEFIAGNRKLVHHASYQVLAVPDDVDIFSGPDYFVYGDSSFVDDAHDYGYFNLINQYGEGPVEVFHSGYLPGTSPQVFNDGIGFRLPKRGILMIRNLHYAPSPVEQTDQSKIHIYFSKKPVDRAIGFAAFKPTNPNPAADWVIPADSIKQFYINVKLHDDISLLAINPHMHKLGKYFKVYCVTPEGDTIKLVEIPDWDFNWQEFYRFKNIVKLPKGSVLRAEALFDNTAANDQNPYSPPRNVYFERGMDDKDEMMRLVMLYLPYKEGDEAIVLEKQLSER